MLTVLLCCAVLCRVCSEQAEEMMVEEGGFPDSSSGFWWREGEEGCAGLREVCIDMATVIKQVRLLASATQVGAGGPGSM